MFKSISTHLIALYVNDISGATCYNASNFDSFGVEHIPKEIRKNHKKQKYRKKCL